VSGNASRKCEQEKCKGLDALKTTPHHHSIEKGTPTVSVEERGREGEKDKKN